MKHIVKRAGHNEEYDGKKIYAAVFAACVAVRSQGREAELVAGEVMKDVDRWIADKSSVSSHQIAGQVVRALRLYNGDAAYLYEHHRDLS